MSSPDPGLLTVQPLVAQRQQLTRPLDGLEHALLDPLHSYAQLAAVLLKPKLAYIDLALPLGGQGLTTVGLALAGVRECLSLVRLALSLVCGNLPLVRSLVSFVGEAGLIVGSLLAGDESLLLGGLGVAGMRPVFTFHLPMIQRPQSRPGAAPTQCGLRSGRAVQQLS